MGTIYKTNHLLPHLYIRPLGTVFHPGDKRSSGSFVHFFAVDLHPGQKRALPAGELFLGQINHSTEAAVHDPQRDFLRLHRLHPLGNGLPIRTRSNGAPTACGLTTYWSPTSPVPGSGAAGPRSRSACGGPSQTSAGWGYRLGLWLGWIVRRWLSAGNRNTTNGLG